jgi:hypothetical protein
MRRLRAGGSLLPFLLLWLALHAVLVAMLLATKFLFAKSAAVALVLAAGALLLVAGRKEARRKVSYDPVI